MAPGADRVLVELHPARMELEKPSGISIRHCRAGVGDEMLGKSSGWGELYPEGFWKVFQGGRGGFWEKLRALGVDGSFKAFLKVFWGGGAGFWIGS